MQFIDILFWFLSETGCHANLSNIVIPIEFIQITRLQHSIVFFFICIFFFATINSIKLITRQKRKKNREKKNFCNLMRQIFVISQFYWMRNPRILFLFFISGDHDDWRIVLWTIRWYLLLMQNKHWGWPTDQVIDCHAQEITHFLLAVEDAAAAQQERARRRRRHWLSAIEDLFHLFVSIIILYLWYW